MYYNQKSSIENLIKTEALIEQHLHGGFGVDFSKCAADDFVEFSNKIIKYGVSGFFPTLATDTIENLKRQIREINKAKKMQSNSSIPMAKILGIHLEACFLNPEKKGIHDSTQLLQPTIDNFKKLEDNFIKIVTLAPELDKDFALCKYLKSKGIRVSAGHCTATDLSQVHQVTHLYNAMGVFSHKTKSTVTEALINNDIYTELIADFKHVDENAIKVVFRTKPLSKIILISDALPITHSKTDKMIFCNKDIFLKDDKATDENGILAGSTMFVSEIISLLVNKDIIDFYTAVKMASSNIDYVERPDSQLFWDKNFNICAIRIDGVTTSF